MGDIRKAGVYRYLDTAGDGSGTINAVGNYATETKFFIKPAQNEEMVIHRMLVSVIDSGSFDSGSYGNGISGISIEVKHQRSGAVFEDLTNGVPIVTNVDWASHCYDAAVSKYGLGNEYLNVRWTFSKGGQPIVLRGIDLDELQVLITGNLTGLVGHYFFVHGFYL